MLDFSNKRMYPSDVAILVTVYLHRSPWWWRAGHRSILWWRPVPCPACCRWHGQSLSCPWRSREQHVTLPDAWLLQVARCWCLVKGEMWNVCFTMEKERKPSLTTCLSVCLSVYLSLSPSLSFFFLSLSFSFFLSLSLSLSLSLTRARSIFTQMRTLTKRHQERHHLRKKTPLKEERKTPLKEASTCSSHVAHTKKLPRYLSLYVTVPKVQETMSTSSQPR